MQEITRRSVMSQGVLVAGGSFVLTGLSRANGDKLKYYDVREWGLEGRGWDKTVKYFDRLPAKAEKTVRKAVWGLSRHSAGMSVLFETDARAISVKWKLSSANLSMPHMPATGMSGVDLYGLDDHGKWRWVGCPRPTRQENDMVVASGIKAGYRRYQLYLPLYNGTESLMIGVSESAKFKPVAPRKEKPLVFYGTSIVHGACASRPGMPHPSILGRWFNRPIINLGFSGNGKMEMALAELLGELDAEVYIVDCLPNMNGELVSKNAVPFVKRLRQLRPETPIVLVEDRSFTNSYWFESRKGHHAASRKALREAYKQLVADKVKGLVYIPGEELLGDDGEGATDGSHPSDLGFMRQAQYMYPFLKPLVG